MDVEMRDLDGIDATRAIKDGCRNRFVPVIFLTGRTDDRTLEQCLRVGGDDFLSKPINPVVLVAKLDALLRIRDLNELAERQRAELEAHKVQMQWEEQIAERVYSRLVKRAREDSEIIRFQASPLSLLEGELLLIDRMPAGDLRVLVGDFAGHGLASVIGTPQVCEVFHELTAKGKSIKEVVGVLNRKLDRILPANLFMACCILELDVNHEKLSIWNGGMPEVLIRSLNGGISQRGRSEHLPLGVAGAAMQNFTPDILPIQLGDRVLAYTDRAVAALLPKKKRGDDAAGNAAQDRTDIKTLYTDANADEAFDRVCKATAGDESDEKRIRDIVVVEIHNTEGAG